MTAAPHPDRDAERPGDPAPTDAGPVGTDPIEPEPTGDEPGVDGRTGLLRLSLDDCIAILASSSIGRIVFVDGDQPIALPVNYGWFEESVVFRTGEGLKLTAALDGQRVGFEVDRIDETTHSGVSVLVKGEARVVENWAEQEQLEQLDVRPWQRQPWRRGWVRVAPTEITGRKLERR
ncbi:MAG: pyridoxamine 5'-phosphate oxidase family protein [Actinomycetota bacterium]